MSGLEPHGEDTPTKVDALLCIVFSKLIIC